MRRLCHTGRQRYPFLPALYGKAATDAQERKEVKMKLLEEKDSAMTAYRIFLRQKTLQKVYLYAIKIFGKPFAAILTETERAAQGLPESKALIVYGSEQKDRDAWKRCRAFEDDPCIRRLKEYVRHCKAVTTAEKLEKKWEKERTTTI